MNIVGKEPREGHDYSEKDFKRFFSKVQWQDNGCLHWVGAINSDGYGGTNKGKTHLRSHRVFYDIFNGEIPEGMKVCHSCDVRNCVNPKHLWLGTTLQNNSDRAKKKRNGDQTGSKNNQQKLDDGKVFTILNLSACGMIQREIADIFGVTQTMIGRIVLGKAWTHVKNEGYTLTNKEQL